ncbi:MAG TPA: undecaprenyl-diphosphate phosphatase [Saprospiraceae bacterium]|nr:undecaprenyl-diphosphate phosphatase [Saprospiraceae bacterium]
MELLKALLLGIVQGLTEFLPVSSSGHLEIAKVILGDRYNAEENLMMTIVLHFATALATVYVFRQEIKKLLSNIHVKNSPAQKYAFHVFISMLPAGLIGYFFQDQLKLLFDERIGLVGICLLFTGILLFIANKGRKTHKKIGWLEALLIGVSQAVALLPGISRSGATISTGVIIGVDRSIAAEFSFLMVLPLIFLKIGDDILHLRFSGLDQEWMLYLAVGFTAAFLTGVFACKWMIRLVKNFQLNYFAYYCFLIGAAAIFYGWTIS